MNIEVKTGKNEKGNQMVEVWSDMWGYGYAVCNPKDEYDPGVGVAIAVVRAAMRFYGNADMVLVAESTGHHEFVGNVISHSDVMVDADVVIRAAMHAVGLISMEFGMQCGRGVYTAVGAGFRIHEASVTIAVEW